MAVKEYACGEKVGRDSVLFRYKSRDVEALYSVGTDHEPIANNERYIQDRAQEYLHCRTADAIGAFLDTVCRNCVAVRLACAAGKV